MRIVSYTINFTFFSLVRNFQGQQFQTLGMKIKERFYKYVNYSSIKQFYVILQRSKGFLKMPSTDTAGKPTIAQRMEVYVSMYRHIHTYAYIYRKFKI